MDDIDLANEHNQRFQDAILSMRPKPRPIAVEGWKGKRYRK